LPSIITSPPVGSNVISDDPEIVEPSIEIVSTDKAPIVPVPNNHKSLNLVPVTPISTVLVVFGIKLPVVFKTTLLEPDGAKVRSPVADIDKVFADVMVPDPTVKLVESFIISPVTPLNTAILLSTLILGPTTFPALGVVQDKVPELSMV